MVIAALIKIGLLVVAVRARLGHARSSRPIGLPRREHDAHLFFRRAHADAVLLGDGAFHRERTASLFSW